MHWQAARELARRYPAIEVDPEVLYVDNGQVLTSAGAAAGLDLCLHMVRCDLGSKTAATTARAAVMPWSVLAGQPRLSKSRRGQVSEPHRCCGNTLAQSLELHHSRIATHLEVPKSIERSRENSRYLPGHRLGPDVNVTPEMRSAVSGAQIVIGAIVLLVVLAILVPAIIVYVQNESKWTLKEQRNTRAFQLAEAAVEGGADIVEGQARSLLPNQL